MPEERVYDPTLGQTIVRDKDTGKFISSEEGNTLQSFPLPIAPESQKRTALMEQIKPMLKDFAVDAASTGAMFIPGLGPLGRVGASLAAGTLTGKALNKEENEGQLTDAAVNTAIAGLVQGLSRNTIKFRPNMRVGRSGWGNFFAYLDPRNLLQITPKTMQTTSHVRVPAGETVTIGRKVYKGGQMTPRTKMTEVPVGERPLREFLMGLAANLGIDLSFNKPVERRLK